MTFQNPAGLWVLLGIPLLILLYLLHSRREKRIVSSTYVWKLSERFLKRKTKISRWHKLLLLLIQILAVLTLSLALSRPALTVGMAKDYILLFDTSVSMRAQNEAGITRLDEAKAKAKELLGEVSKGNRITVILIGEEATALANRSSDEGMLELALQHLRCGEGSAAEEEGFALAKSIANTCRNPAVIYYTDRPSTDKLYRPFLTVVDCSDREEKWNLSLSDMSATKAEGKLTFSASLLTDQSGRFTVALAVDGRTLDAIAVTAEATRPQTVTFSLPSQTYGYAEIYVEAEDAIAEDNRVAIAHSEQSRRQALLVSQTPLFIETVLGVMQGWDVVVTTSPTDSHMSPHTGYDLYIFDGITPPEYPTDGSVLTVGTDEHPGGVLLGETVYDEGSLLPGRTSPFTENITLDHVALSTYRPLLANSTWDVLLTCHDEPVMISRQMAEGLRYTCLSFDLHHSNLPANYNYFALFSAVINASAPPTVDSHLYPVGEEVAFSKLPRSLGVEVLYPNGIKRALSFENGVAHHVFHQAGVYTVLQHFEGGNVEKTYFCMEIPMDEWKNTSLSGLPDIQPAEASDGQNAISDVSLYLLAAVLLLLILEWGVYYREKC